MSGRNSVVECLLTKQEVADFSHNAPPNMTNVLNNTDTTRGSEDLPTCLWIQTSPLSWSDKARAAEAGLFRYIPNS